MLRALTQYGTRVHLAKDWKWKPASDGKPGNVLTGRTLCHRELHRVIYIGEEHGRAVDCGKCKRHGEAMIHRIQLVLEGEW